MPPSYIALNNCWSLASSGISPPAAFRKISTISTLLFSAASFIGVPLLVLVPLGSTLEIVIWKSVSYSICFFIISVDIFALYKFNVVALVMSLGPTPFPRVDELHLCCWLLLQSEEKIRCRRKIKSNVTLPAIMYQLSHNFCCLSSALLG